jgi:hypothetical protein
MLDRRGRSILVFSSAPICADDLRASGALGTVTELLGIHKEFALEVEDLV